MKKINFSLFIILMLSIFAISGCKNDNDATAIPLPVVDPPDPDVPTPGVVDEVGGFNIKVNPPAGANYYIHQASDFTKRCVIEKTATGADLDIICTVEVEELEGAFHGIDMVLNTPSDMCTYVQFDPYYYFGKNYGAGPATAEVRYDTDGRFVGGVVTGATFTPDGNLRCDYDYSSSVPAGPNCCTGTYDLTIVRNYQSADPSKPETTTNTTGNQWGGRAVNCLSGAGNQLTSPDPISGMPMSLMTYSADGFNRSFKTSPTLSLGVGSVWYANYYTGAPPAALKLGALDSPKGNRYYTWRCLTDAHDTVARIRVEIREWNEMSEFLLKDLGNPETSGADPDWPAFDLNNWSDWADYGNLFPGLPR